MDPALIRRIVEAALLASPQPLSPSQLAGLFPEDAPPPPGSIERALGELIEQNGQRGVALVEVASGFRYQVESDVLPWVSRLWAERPARYSRALLETLALIAYRQPITRGEIEQIRGVSVSSHIIKTLEEREWIRVVGHRDVPGRPALFGTTRGFLDYFGLRSLDQLPPLTELQELPDLEPELPLEGITGPAAAALSAPDMGTDDAASPDSGAVDGDASSEALEAADGEASTEVGGGAEDEVPGEAQDLADAIESTVAHEAASDEASTAADPAEAPDDTDARTADEVDAGTGPTEQIDTLDAGSAVDAEPATEPKNESTSHPESQADDGVRPEHSP